MTTYTRAHALVPVDVVRRAVKIAALEIKAQTFQQWADLAWRELAAARAEDEQATLAEQSATEAARSDA